MSSNKNDFPIRVWKEGKHYLAEVPVVPGCHTQGSTRKEAQRKIEEALDLCLEEAGVNKWYCDQINFCVKFGSPDQYGNFHSTIR